MNRVACRRGMDGLVPPIPSGLVCRKDRRSLGTTRRWRSGGVERLEARVTPATITVTSLADSGPGTLRGAIEQANLVPQYPLGPQDTIVFAPSLAGRIRLQSALPDLTSAENIEGPGPSVITIERGTAQGTPNFRIFTIPSTVTQSLTISGLTIEGGNLVGANGGGISNGGPLFLTNCVVQYNTISGVNGQGTEGAGVYNDGGMVLTNDRIVSNTITSDGAGGGVYGAGVFNGNGQLVVTNTTVQFNTIMGSTRGPGGVGGAGIADMSPLGSSIQGSSISYNMVNGGWSGGAQGGGVDNGASSFLTITTSTIAGNFVTNHSTSAVQGGGINNGGSLNLLNDTIVANLVPEGNASFPPANASVDQGGGIMNQQAATTTITYCTIAGNKVGYVVDSTPEGLIFVLGQGGGIDNLNPIGLGLVDSIVAGNTSAAPLTFTDVTGPLLPGSTHNLIGDGVGLTGITNGVGGNLIGTDATPIDPLLGQLADNGGPTMTEALLPGSPALGAGLAVPLPWATWIPITTDQRGQPRVSGAAPDMGAYEVQFPPPTVVRVERFGVRWQPTQLMVSYSDAMNPATASNPSNYRLIRLVRNGHGGFRAYHTVPIRSVSYNPAAHSATITPGHRLPLRFVYRLELNGASSTGLADLAGNDLDAPSAGAPGGDYFARLARSSLAFPVSRMHL